METKPARLWTPTDVARFLGVPVATLYQWRRRGVGPPARRVGRLAADQNRLLAQALSLDVRCPSAGRPG